MFNFGSNGTFFLLVLYLQHVLGFGAFENGLAFLPTTALVSVLALTLGPRLMRRFGRKGPHVFGIATFGCGIFLLVWLPVHGGFWNDFLPAMVVLGIGGGIFAVPNVTIAMADSAPGDSGLVSGIFNVAPQLGAALGIATVASVAGIRTKQLSATGASRAVAEVGGFHLGFLVAVAALVVAIVAGVLVRSPAITVPTDADTLAALRVTEIETI